MKVVLIKSYARKPWRNPETYRLIERSLGEKWSVSSLDTRDPETLHKLLVGLKQKAGEQVFVFNIAEYLNEENKAGFLPALLDEWNVPHLGSSAESIAIGLDKARTKALLERKGIATPSYFVVEGEAPSLKRPAQSIGFPLIVKPIGEGGHLGISPESIVHDLAGLEKAVKRIFIEYDEPALVEQYIGGEGMREFSVGIIDGELSLFVPMEIDYASMHLDQAILSYEAAQKDLERIKLVSNRQVREEIIDLSLRTFRAVGARDYSRVDLRMNQSGCYVLEINTMPGLGPHSFFPQAAKEMYDLEYNQFIQRLAEVAMQH
jgi:D-alanine-D-alanine ligase